MQKNEQQQQQKQQQQPQYQQQEEVAKYLIIFLNFFFKSYFHFPCFGINLLQDRPPLWWPVLHLHWFGVLWLPMSSAYVQQMCLGCWTTVDGWNPAITSWGLVDYFSLFKRFHTSQVVQDFWSINSRWWLHMCFSILTPKPWGNDPIWHDIFQMGWNHHLV